MLMPFGRHKGIPIEELPDDYLKWLANEATIRGSLKRLITSEYKARFDPKPDPVPVKKERPKSGPGCWRCSLFEGLSKEQKELAAFMIDAWCSEMVRDINMNPGRIPGEMSAATLIQAVQAIRDMVTTKT